MRVMHWREKAGVFCGFTLLPIVFIRILTSSLLGVKWKILGKLGVLALVVEGHGLMIILHLICERNASLNNGPPQPMLIYHVFLGFSV